LVKTFKSGNEAKAWVMKSPGGHSIMTKKDWDVSEGKSEVEGVNEASGPLKLKDIKINKKSPVTFVLEISFLIGNEVVISYLTTGTSQDAQKLKSKVEKAFSSGKIVSPSGIGYYAYNESVNEAVKPTIKVVSKLKNEQGIQIVVVKTTKGETMYGGFVVRGKLQKVIPVGANNSKEGVQKRALQIWDEFGKQLGESVNEAGDERFDWPPVLDKFKGKEIDKVEAEYKASLAKSSAILDKQRQLIRTTLGNKFEFPWENYDKWPAKLKAEVEKLNSQIDKEREKQPAMFKKLMQARGTWR
jgi:hypothetical protein